MVVAVQEVGTGKTVVALGIAPRTKFREIGIPSGPPEEQFHSSEGGRPPRLVVNTLPLDLLASPVPYHEQSSYERLRAVRVPQLQVREEAKALLTNRTKPLAQTVAAIIHTKILQTRIPVRQLLLSAVSDPEEDWQELVFQIKVAGLPAQALAFWDCVGDEIDRWKTTLPATVAELVNEGVTVHVIWEEPRGVHA